MSAVPVVLLLFLLYVSVFIERGNQSTVTASPQTVQKTAHTSQAPGNGTEAVVSADELQKCWTDPNMVKAATPDYFDMNRQRIDEPAFRVVGVTPNCFVYYGWLHQLVKEPVNDPVELRSNYSEACRDFRPFLIRTEGKKMLLIIVAKRYGRRILVQTVARETVVSSSDKTSVIWMEFNPYLRHEQFTSNQFPRSFSFQMLQNLAYRIYIFGYSITSTIILELKIYIDENNNLIPFITDKVLSVDPVIHAPLYSSWIVPVHNLKHGNHTVNGFIFVRQVYKNNKPQHGSYITFAIPMLSLLTYSEIGASKVPTYDGYIYHTKYFTTYSNRKCPQIGNYMIFTDYSYMNWTPQTLPTPELTLLKMSRRRWFNPLRFHRRMSYPHAFHRAQRQGIFRSWIKALPGILVNCALMAAILFSIEYLVHLHEKMRARMTGLSRSHSACSF